MLVNVTIPVYNEAKALPSSISTLHGFLQKHGRFDWEIVIANNASTDHTLEVAHELAKNYSGVRVVHLDQKGRGRALTKAWSESQADILSYMDVDLSSNLYAFPPLIEALLGGGFEIAIGSRLLKASTTRRSFRREVISRSYNLLVKAFFLTKFSDAQCGFKAITRRAAQDLLPKTEDTGWFFDTELLVIGEKLGYRIFDLPVSWIEDLDSRVKIVRTAIDDIKGLIRVWRNFRKGVY
ncbi:MAG: glycosyltransferase family 2 protein [Ignavibacteriales bacterium]|nr:glycosyltransferase family 2 protein [Ignavibacteriales bacterium]